MIRELFKKSAIINFGKCFFSDEFLEIARKKLIDDFIHKTKIADIDETVQLNLSNTNCAYIRNHPYQKINVRLLVINNSFAVTVVWRMKSDFGLPVRPFQTDIDDQLFDMWFENLPVEDILKAYHKEPPKLNIDENSLHYKLIIGHFFSDTTYLIIQCPNSLKTDIADLIGKKINTWNQNSEENNRKLGLIHNGRIFRDLDENQLIYLIDFGSASDIGLIHILKQLNRFDSISEIKVTSFIK